MSKASHLRFFLAASFLWSLNLSAQPDISPHKVEFVTVGEGVRLEVLDWGGSGRPLIFLAGNGDTAHAFDTFAPKFTSENHVYGIARALASPANRHR
jgi:non-heme chloroperoxidase